MPWGGVLKLPSYGFSIMIGFLLCLWLVRRRGRRFDLPGPDLLDLSVFLLFAGVVGARLFYVIEFWDEYFKGHPLRIIRLDQGGLVFFGGLLGALPVLLLFIHFRKLPALRTLDVLVGVVPLGHAFGRLGCFLNGCCFGRVTGLPWAVRFPRIEEGNDVVGSPAYLHQVVTGEASLTDTHSCPVHPTQLYAVVYLLLAFLVLTWMLRRRSRPGVVASSYLLLYAPFRFLNEHLRADTPPVLLGMSVAQIIAIVGFVAGIGVLVWCLRRPRPEAEVAVGAQAGEQAGGGTGEESGGEAGDERGDAPPG
jgi:phosphatidylglycerol:prolipoprotein diacylglycerol transferase